MLDNIVRIKAIREAGRVVRCHTSGRTHDDYNNAQHQYGVAILYAILWPGDHAGILASLVHDVPERWMGDLPSPQLGKAKELRAFLQEEEKLIAAALDLPSEHALDEQTHRRMKDADRLDLYLWALEEVRRGNSEFNGYVKRILAFWEKNPPLPETLVVIEHTLENGWDRLPEPFHEVLNECQR